MHPTLKTESSSSMKHEAWPDLARLSIDAAKGMLEEATLKRRRGRRKAPRCNECRSCQNRHWNLSCEKKTLLEGLSQAVATSVASARSSSSGIQRNEPPDRREIIRIETLGDDRDLRKQLSYLLKVPLGDVGRIRMTPEKQPSLIDTISVLTRKSKHESAKVWRRLEGQFPTLGPKCPHAAFPNHGRETPVAGDLKTLIQVIFLLPGREASLVRQAAAEVFIRFMGGDLSLIQDVRRMNEIQSFLRENDPEHPMRVFGEAVETAREEPSTSMDMAPCSQTLPPRVPPNPVIMKVVDSIGMPGSDHLYAASRLEDNILKIGVSKDVVDRMPELSRNFQAGYSLQAVWPGEAALEEIVLEKLKPYRATVGTSREHFDSRVTLEYLYQIVDHARALYKTKMELSSTSFEQKKRELEFQEDLKDRALKRKREEISIEAERAREKLYLETEIIKLDAEKARLEAEKSRIKQEASQEELLQKLVSESNPEAIKVFLERLSRKKP